MFFRKKTQVKANAKNPKNTRRLTLESLEGRQLMAGDVTAGLVNGDLYISEVPSQVGQDNGIRVSRLANGKIQVLGTVANGTDPVASKVNGLAAQEFTVNGSLFVNFGAGNDRVQIGFDGGASAPTFTKIQINVAAPPLTVSQSAATRVVDSGFIDVFSPPDSDQVLLWGANTRSSLSINTGDKNDWVFLGQVTIGDGIGVDNVSINTGSGPDQVTFKGTNVRGNLDVQTYAAVAENDQDGVFIDSVYDPSYADVYRPTIVAGSTDLRTGGGADSIYVSDPSRSDVNQFWTVFQTHGYVSMDTGAGNDTLLVRNAKIGEDSYDDVNLDNLVVNTGAGADNARFHSINVGVAFQLQMFASAFETDVDIASVDHLYANRDISVLTGGGDDQATLDNITAYWNLNVDMGAGNDRLDLLDYVIALKYTNLFGGDGVDRLTYRSNNYLHSLTKTGWEYINGIPQKISGLGGLGGGDRTLG